MDSVSQLGISVQKTHLKVRNNLMGSNPTNACGYMICKYIDWNGSDAMLTSIQSAGVASEVNLRITQMRKHARHLAMKPKQQKSQQGYHCLLPKRTCVLQFFLKSVLASLTLKASLRHLFTLSERESKIFFDVCRSSFHLFAGSLKSAYWLLGGHTVFWERDIALLGSFMIIRPTLGSYQ